MKRVWIACAVLISVIAVGIFSLISIKNSVSFLAQELASLESLISSGADPKLLEEASMHFEAAWEKEEALLMHYIHHNSLDDITGVVARLKALSAYGDYAELSAEVARLRHLVEHVYQSEKPGISSIL